MRSDKQVEASVAARRASLYEKIASVFDSMPHRFKPTDLYKAAGITHHNHPGQRMMIASVLMHDFRCEKVGERNKELWRKPGEECQ